MLVLMSASVRRPLSLLTIFILSLTSEAQLTWHLVDNGTRGMPVPAARRDAAIGYDGTLNKLVLFGGRTSQNGATLVLGDTLIFDLSKGTWKPVTKGERPQPRFSMVYGSSEYYLYIAMGQGHNKVFYNDIWRFDMRSEKWLKLPEQKRPSYYTADHWAALSTGHVYPEARSGAGGGIFVNSTEFFVSLGTSQRQYGDTYSYLIPEMGWYLVSPDKGPYQPFLPHPRSLHAAVMISKSELLIFGGCLSGGHTGGPCPTADSWIFDARTLTWKKQPTCATPRTMASLAMLPIVNEQRRVILYGGEEEGPGMQVLTTIKSRKDEVAVFNPDSGVWVLRRTSGDIPPKKASVSMVTGRTGIYMFGGYDIESDRVTNDLYLLHGDSVTADTAPVLAGCNPTFFNLLILHGILMTLAWGLFLPWGAFIVRYCRRNEPLRYNLHRLFQIFGLLLCVAGFICGVLSVINDHFNFVHAIVGLVTTIIGLLQPLNACVRPSLKSADKKMASRYFVWKMLHSVFGSCSIGLGLVNVSLGLFLAHSHTIIWILWYSYLGLFILCHLLARINRNRTGVMAGKEGATSGQENARYIVTDIIPASELPAELFEGINRNKCEEAL